MSSSDTLVNERVTRLGRVGIVWRLGEPMVLRVAGVCRLKASNLLAEDTEGELRFSFGVTSAFLLVHDALTEHKGPGQFKTAGAAHFSSLRIRGPQMKSQGGHSSSPLLPLPHYPSSPSKCALHVQSPSYIRTETYYRAPTFSCPVLYRADDSDWITAVLHCCLIAPDVQVPERGTSCESRRCFIRVANG